MKRNEILNSVAIAGGGIMFLLNILTEGAVPGGMVGGMVGGIIGYLIASVVVPKDKDEKVAGPTAEIVAPENILPPNEGWYIKEDAKKNLRQIVLKITGIKWDPSRFASLVLGTKYAALISNDWITGFFRLENQPGPFLLLRTDGFVPQIMEAGLRIGFSFFRTHHGGLFVLYVEPSPRIPRSPHPFIEIVYGLDVEDNRERIRDALQKNSLDIVLADQSNFEYTFADTSGVQFAPYARFDTCVPLPSALREALVHEWEALLDWHDNLPASSKNHHAAAQAMWDKMPLDKSPLLTG